MQRRYFEHVYTEICVAVGRRISRYDLWLAIWDAGGDPDDLTREHARSFAELGLGPLLREEGLALEPRARRRLQRRIVRFDPDHPTPEEWLARLAPSVRRAA